MASAGPLIPHVQPKPFRQQSQLCTIALIHMTVPPAAFLRSRAGHGLAAQRHDGIAATIRTARTIA